MDNEKQEVKAIKDALFNREYVSMIFKKCTCFPLENRESVDVMQMQTWFQMVQDNVADLLKAERTKREEAERALSAERERAEAAIYAQGEMFQKEVEAKVNLKRQVEALESKLKGYEEMHKDHKRLVRELDVAVYGDGAAKQASLCDLIMPIKNKITALEAKVKELQSWKDQVNLLDSRVDDLVDSPIKHKLIQKYMEVDSLESQVKELEYQNSDLLKALKEGGKLAYESVEMHFDPKATVSVIEGLKNDLATANAKIVELEKEIQAKNNEDSTQPNTIKENLSYFVSMILNAHAARALGREPMDFPSMGNEEATLKIIKKFESELSTVNKKAEKLVEALEPIRQGGYSGASYIVQQALKEFRGGE